MPISQQMLREYAKQYAPEMNSRDRSRNLPVIFKEAFSTAQLRAIKKVVPITRKAGKAGEEITSQIQSDPITWKPLNINIPRGQKNPIDALMHEFGHYIDNQKGGIINDPSQGIILPEIMANRQAARWLMHTGSRPGEVKRFIRNSTPWMKSYIASYDFNIIRDHLFKEPHRFPGAMDMLKKAPATVEWKSTNPTAQVNARNISEHISKVKRIPLDPYAKARTAIDLTPNRLAMQWGKAVERDTFNKVVRKDKLPRILGTQEVIHLGDKG